MPKVKPPLDMSKVSTVVTEKELPPRPNHFVRQPNPFDEVVAGLKFNEDGRSTVQETKVRGVKAGALGPYADAIRGAVRHVDKGVDIRIADELLTWQVRPLRPRASGESNGSTPTEPS